LSVLKKKLKKYADKPMNQKENDNINKTNLRVDEGECFISRTFEEVSQRK